MEEISKKTLPGDFKSMYDNFERAIKKGDSKSALEQIQFASQDLTTFMVHTANYKSKEDILFIKYYQKVIDEMERQFKNIIH